MMGIELLILTVIGNGFRHLHIIEEKKEFINYRKENLISATLILGICVIIFFFINPGFGVLSLMVSPSIRWIFHDLTLNIGRGLKWDYLGERSKLDQSLKKFEEVTGLHHYWMKMMGVVLNVGSVVLLFVIWGKITTRTISRNVHDYLIDFDSTAERRKFLLISDLHLDNPKCNRKLLKRHLREAKEEGASVMMFGDIFCAMQGVKDRRGSKSQLKASQLEGPYFDVLVDDAEEFFSPYVEEIDFMSYGNHETAIIRHNEIDLLAGLKRRLDQKKENGEVMLGQYGGWVRFMVNYKGWRGLKKLKYFHGSGGNSPVTKGAIQQQRAAVMYDCDIMVMGHNHQRNMTVHPREILTQGGVIKKMDQIHLRCATYKDEWGDGGSGWSVEKGFGPSPLGGWWLEMWHQDNEVKIRYWAAD